MSRWGSLDENPKPKGFLPKGVNIENLTLEMAVWSFVSTRTLGVHPGSGKNPGGLGPFGPYVVHDQGRRGKTIDRSRLAMMSLAFPWNVP